MKCLDIDATACEVFLAEEKDDLSGPKNMTKIFYCSFLGDIHCIVLVNLKLKNWVSNLR